MATGTFELLHLDMQTEGREKVHQKWLNILKPQSLPMVTHPLQQDHTS